MSIKLTIQEHWLTGSTAMEAAAETGESLSEVQRVYTMLNAANPGSANMG